MAQIDTIVGVSRATPKALSNSRAFNTDVDVEISDVHEISAKLGWNILGF